jgi:ABC-2 type transport system ATP-binding protein
MRIEKLGKEINNRSILQDITLTIKKGEITGLIGQNGSGKTTFFRSIAGHYEPDEGQIFIEKQDIKKHVHLKQQLFYIDEQYNFLAGYSLHKLQQFYQCAYQNFDNKKYSILLKKHKLHAKMNYHSLSKGMQGLYKMILAVCSNAEYLLLDEPFDGLDVIVKKKVIRMLLDDVSEQKRAIIISSHNLTELESLIDRALILKDNQIQYDYHLEQLREKARKLQMVFKTKKVPQVVKKNSRPLHYQGRVITAIFENYTDEIERMILAERPLLFEEVPLTLEDVFEVHVTREDQHSSRGGVL